MEVTNQQALTHLRILPACELWPGGRCSTISWKSECERLLVWFMCVSRMARFSSPVGSKRERHFSFSF
jgi:hypothetical protein